MVFHLPIQVETEVYRARERLENGALPYPASSTAHGSQWLLHEGTSSLVLGVFEFLTSWKFSDISVSFSSYGCATPHMVVLNKPLQQHCVFSFISALIKRESLQPILLAARRTWDQIEFHPTCTSSDLMEKHEIEEQDQCRFLFTECVSSVVSSVWSCAVIWGQRRNSEEFAFCLLLNWSCPIKFIFSIEPESCLNE